MTDQGEDYPSRTTAACHGSWSFTAEWLCPSVDCHGSVVFRREASQFRQIAAIFEKPFPTQPGIYRQ